MEWTTQRRKLSDLIPTSYNPRTLTKPQQDELKKSLERFGLVEIPVINTDNQLLAGHQRTKVLLLLHGKDYEIDVRVPEKKLTKKQCDEYLLRSNKTTGQWDFDKLVESFGEEDLLDFGFEKWEFGIAPENEVADIAGETAPPEPVKCPHCGYVHGQVNEART